MKVPINGCDHVKVRLRTPTLVNEILGCGSSATGLPKMVSINCSFHHIQQGRAVHLVIGEPSPDAPAVRLSLDFCLVIIK
jgi:hypothetical protein